MKTENIAELRAENININAQLKVAGPRAAAILLACLDINNRKLRAIENANVAYVQFGGKK